MKAISPMIATVLLIAFTVAVGGILAVWFSSYTKTQTSSVSKSSSCASTHLDVSAPVVNNDNIRMMIVNYGPETVNVTSASIKCGNSVFPENLGIELSAGQSNITQITGLSGCTPSNLGITIVASCLIGGSPQGTVQASCPEGSCS